MGLWFLFNKSVTLYIPKYVFLDIKGTHISNTQTKNYGYILASSQLFQRLLVIYNKVYDCSGYLQPANEKHKSRRIKLFPPTSGHTD